MERESLYALLRAIWDLATYKIAILLDAFVVIAQGVAIDF